jgi:hypothetical protein
VHTRCKILPAVDYLALYMASTCGKHSGFTNEAKLVDLTNFYGSVRTFKVETGVGSKIN